MFVVFSSYGRNRRCQSNYYFHFVLTCHVWLECYRDNTCVLFFFQLTCWQNVYCRYSDTFKFVILPSMRLQIVLCLCNMLNSIQPVDAVTKFNRISTIFHETKNVEWQQPNPQSTNFLIFNILCCIVRTPYYPNIKINTLGTVLSGMTLNIGKESLL